MTSRWCRCMTTSRVSAIVIMMYILGLVFIHTHMKVRVRTYTPRANTQNSVHVADKMVTGLSANAPSSKKESHPVKRASKRVTRAKSKVVNLTRKQYDVMVDATCYDESVGFHNATLCRCHPHLNGLIQVSTFHFTNYSVYESDVMIPGLDPGGHWKPKGCVPRRRIGILIPYRDREEHLAAFLNHTHPILQRQLVEYQIFLLEQRYPYTFNKGSVMNAGYDIMKRNTTFRPDCVVFHDVDLLMLTDTNMIMCFDYPIHLGAFIDKFNFSLLYGRMFGGAVAVRPAQFEAVNGFSNMFRGWGGEDDDFYGRTARKLRKMYRGPKEVSMYSMIKHDHDTANPVNQLSKGKVKDQKAAQKALRSYTKHGLNTVKYSLVDITYRHLYTHIVIDLPDTDSDVTKIIQFARLNSTECKSDIYGEHVVSMVTCEAMCFRNITGCAAFQYTQSTHSHSTCQLLISVCHGPVPSKNVNLYVKEK